MAIVGNNAIVNGASGMLGGQIVFRKWNGKTIMANRPKAPSRESVLQKTNRQKFKEATQFAKVMMLIPDRKVYYQERAKKMKVPNGYTAAITDYMRGVVVKDLAVSNDKKCVTATVYKKDFRVASVEVIVKDVNGVVIERGVMKDLYNGKWRYVLAGVFAGGIIEVVVKDVVQNSRFEIVV